MAPRDHCPSCHHRLSPYAVECPVCGLGRGGKDLPRPLLFQASALRNRGSEAVHRPQAISAPALGRVAPVVLEAREPALEPAPTPGEVPHLGLSPDPEPLPDSAPPLGTSLWPLVRLEVGEFLLLLGANLVLLLAGTLMLDTPPGRLYGELWPLLLPVHLAVSWALFMVPLALAGQSPLMGRLGFLVEAPQPERRLAFSLFHLLSVATFPVSFLCMLLTPEHRTLAELLSGQEILAVPPPRLR